MVGLLPLCAVTVFEGELLRSIRRSRRALPPVPRGAAGADGVHPRPDASAACTAARSASILDETKLRRVLATMLDEREFLEPVRHPLALALSRRAPVRVPRRRRRNTASSYLPAESDSGMFGGNSNWRGPIWMPVNAPDHPGAAAVLRLLRRRLHRRVPDRLGTADERCIRSPRRSRAGWPASSCATSDGRRPVYGGTRQVPGRSALARSASCSTSTSTATTAPASAPATRPGWTGIVARLMHLFATTTRRAVLEVGKAMDVMTTRG